ncbi:hypothetical protein BJ138DRAFT_995221 [Hygrophoropsis aurantiaca]|uniref:Uncharacterized protein n=1 Tax=Hygrophoropsis aurantiaca TaxID=72124 RepID=A0ACB8AV25_9AGAM|nr:hypothetical protein BJ138DRAFT_995221 [Hygrophoropsis aurantiaca]
MSFLACIVKPLAYISLPVFLIRTVASTSPVARYYVRLGVFLGSLAVVSTWGVAIAVGMTLVGRRHDVNYVVARCFYFVASRALDIRVEVEGEEHLQTRPAVMVGNHQSMLDILWLAKMFPPSASIMAKKELQWSPLGPWMFMSGALFVDRGNSAKAHRSLAAAGELMKAQGTSLMMYPEGTRHSEEVPSLLPFKKGAFHLAVQAGIPITPIICENYWGIYHQGVLGTGTLKVRILPPIPTSGITPSDIPELASRIREQMLVTLRDISVKVASNEDIPATESPETQPESLTRVQEADGGPSATDESLPGASETPSDESNNEAASVSGSRILKQEGSEYGTETDDEGMVVVGRHH